MRNRETTPGTQVGLGFSVGSGVVITIGVGQRVQAHGGVVPEPTLSSIFTAWSGELLPWIGIAAATAGYLVAVRLVNRAHPMTPVPRRRVAAWLSGVTILAIALVSAVDVYATELLSVHMVQHLLLTMVAPPILALGAPITLLLRVSEPEFRRSILLPILHSRLVQAISWPPVGWIVFAVVMWVTHFSPLFDAALEQPLLHTLEHLLYLAAGLLFWWPVIGVDPSLWRLTGALRMAYLVGQMPLNAAVGLAIYFAPTVLYAHYATSDRIWGPDPFTDQQVAGIVMWAAGDVILLTALVLAIAAWLRADEKRTRIIEARGTP
jgi:cytochrome c oxidase assembly factor CtaG